MERPFEKEAAEFVNAIRDLAARPETLYNLECYLSRHFDKWLERFSDSPANITAEMQEFAKIL